MIPALLNGVAAYIGTGLGDPTKVQSRDGENGAPLGAWKTSQQWFVGVYFGGAEGTARESYCLRYTVGIDITRMIPLISTRGPRTEKLLAENDLWDKVGRINEMMLAGRSKVAIACNAVVPTGWASAEGSFHENFERSTIGKMTTPSPAWCLQVPGEEGDVSPIAVVSMTFFGLAWRKNLAQLFGG